MTRSEAPAIEARGLGKRFGRLRRGLPGFWALRDASFAVAAGEWVGVMGRNGSGKSTLLQLLCGTLTPTTGEAAVRGRLLPLLELGTGFSPELTGRENVYANALALGLRRTDVDERWPRIVGMAGLGEFINEPLGAYSTGMHTRLALAAAVTLEPQVLIMDEGFSSADHGFRQACLQRLEELREGGCAILMAISGTEMADQLCDRILLLEDGRLLLEGRPSEVIPQYLRLLHAAPEALPALRKRIAARAGAAEPPESLPPQESVTADRQTPSYDPELAAERPTSQRGSGAQMEELCLLSCGQRVNVLVPGGEYVCSFRVRLREPVGDVWIILVLTSLSGVPVAKYVSAPVHVGGGRLEKPGLLQCRLRLRCNLLQGLYQIHVDVRGSREAVELSLQRARNALTFRVLRRPGRETTGLADLEIEQEFLALADSDGASQLASN